MRSPKWQAFRLSSKRRSTCEHLRRLYSHHRAALRNERNRYRTAIRRPILRLCKNLEEVLGQTTDARRLVCYAIDAHLTNRHSETPGVAWRRNSPRKESRMKDLMAVKRRISSRGPEGQSGMTIGSPS